MSATAVPRVFCREVLTKIGMARQERPAAIAKAVPGATHRELAGQTHNVNPNVLADAVVDTLVTRGFATRI